MNRVELREALAAGEGPRVEFKRDAVQNHELAAEVVALANHAGGVVLLGVEDDGSILGTTRANLEEWVAELCRVKVDPPLIPYFTWFRNLEPGRDVAVLEILSGPDKPYALVHNNRRRYLVRAGSTRREASAEEFERLFQAAGRVLFGAKPVPGATLDDLDPRRLRNYFEHVLSAEAPSDPAEWTRLLRNLQLLTEASGIVTPTVDGMLLFGRNPKRFLPQSGVRALAYAGAEPDYAVRADEDLRGPLLPLLDVRDEIVESGLVEQALDFLARHAPPGASVKGGRRIDRPLYPPEPVREALVNALVHRDYSVSGTDVSVTLFSDRLEIVSPGRLPNTVTIESMRSGFRFARNQTLVNVLRDYRYVDFRGMGVRTKIIPGMRAHNGTEPRLTERGQSFTVTLLGAPAWP